MNSLSLHFPLLFVKEKCVPIDKRHRIQGTCSVLRMEAHSLPRTLTFHAFSIPGLQFHLFYFLVQPEFVCVEGVDFDRKKDWSGLTSNTSIPCI